MALSNLALFGGAFLTPVVVGKITRTIGWEWSFYLVAISAGLLLPFIFFFVPETAFRRESSLNTDIAPQASISAVQSHSISDRDEKPTSPAAPSLNTIPPKTTFARTLLPFNGRITDESFFKLILRPLPLFFHPAILWGCLIQGAMIGFTVMIGVVLAVIFYGPPLWFTEVNTGYMYTGPFIGAILGFIVAGLLSDWSTRFMIRQNKGVYEPEFRILLVIPQLIFVVPDCTDSGLLPATSPIGFGPISSLH